MGTWCMPNQPKTPTRAFRVPDEIWNDVVKLAVRRGVPVTEIVRLALQKYVEDAVWVED